MTLIDGRQPIAVRPKFLALSGNKQGSAESE